MQRQDSAKMTTASALLAHVQHVGQQHCEMLANMQHSIDELSAGMQFLAAAAPLGLTGLTGRLDACSICWLPV